MPANLIKFIFKGRNALIFGVLVLSFWMIPYAYPATTNKAKINFSETSGQEFEKGSEDLDVPYVSTPMAVVHTLQTNIRYEPGEYNLMKEMHNRGIKGALQKRKEHFKD